MTRKLVVTVFAMSLSLFGCGSDDGDTKDGAADAVKLADSAIKTADASKDGVVTADTKLDVNQTAEVSSDSKPDVAITDGGVKTDGTVVVDAPTSDVPVQTDTIPVGSDAGDGGAVD